MTDRYSPRPEDKFTFGLWTVGNRGRDPFGDAVRPALSPVDAAALLGEVGAWGVNLHDNDLVPIDATPAERDRIVRDFARACEQHHLVVPMATVNLFYDPVFRDGAFTANDARVRAYAVQKTMRAMDLGAELGAKTFVLWGGREGTETDACRRPDEAVKRLRDARQLSLRVLASTGSTATASRSRPSPTSRAATSTWRRPARTSGFIATLEHPEMVGVNPEVAHEQMAGLNFLHAVAQAWEAGKLFHIDLNDQAPGRYDQDFRFGAANLKAHVLPRQVPRGRRLRRPAPLRRARLPHRRLRRREGLRARLHAHVPDPEGAGGALERRRRDPGAPRRSRRTRARARPR